MPKHFDRYKSPHDSRALFDVVADVEKYPEFLPWVSNTRIISSQANVMLVEMVVSFKSFSHKYTSRVEMIKPEAENENCEIRTSMVDGPFKRLHNNWLFRPMERGGTEILFELDFEFKSFLLEKLIGTVFERAVTKMTSAFEKRADDLLGR